MSKILILGGYGGFGARLSRRLAAAGHELLVAGRHHDRAAAFCANVPGTIPLVADRDGDLSALLAAHAPDLLIDAAGPFQGSDDRVPRACIAAGVAYLDLADAREFVTGIGALDGPARAARVPVVTGTSSVPALSGAVVRELAQGMDRITAVELAISASNRAAAGPSVAAAILSYVGRPLPLRRGRRATTGYGWQELQTAPFDLGDGQPLRHRLVALADVPDLGLLPDRLPDRPAVSFRAGTELRVQMFALWLASWPVRWRWLRSLRGLAGTLGKLQRLTGRFGSDRSGMVVRLFGWRDGHRIERRWTLIADRGDGPEIPTLAAALLADRLGTLAPGAYDAGELLTLADFEPLFAGLAIRHATRDIVQLKQY